MGCAFFFFFFFSLNTCEWDWTFGDGQFCVHLWKENDCKRATSVAHFTNFSFQLFFFGHQTDHTLSSRTYSGCGLFDILWKAPFELSAFSRSSIRNWIFFFLWFSHKMPLYFFHTMVQKLTKNSNEGEGVLPLGYEKDKLRWNEVTVCFWRRRSICWRRCRWLWSIKNIGLCDHSF